MLGVPVGMTLMRDFYQEIIDIIGAGGEACCVIPFGDSAFENAAHTTFVTKGQGALDNLTCTYSKDRKTFDLPVIVFRNRFQAALQPIDGVDEEADTPDAAAWSRDDGSSEGMSFGALVNFIDATSDAILSRFGASVAEWEFATTSSDELTMEVNDVSAGVGATRKSDAAIRENNNLFVGATYDGSGGASAADGMIMYAGGLVIASTATNNASYVAMENLTSTTTVGFREAGPGLFLDGLLGVLFFTHRVLSAVEMFNLNDIYVAMQRADRSRLLAGVL